MGTAKVRVQKARRFISCRASLPPSTSWRSWLGLGFGLGVGLGLGLGFGFGFGFGFGLGLGWGWVWG